MFLHAVGGWRACLLCMELFVEHCAWVAHWFVWCCTHCILQIIRCSKILEARLGRMHAICTWNWNSQILSQQNGSTVHSFCLSYLHTCIQYGTGEFYAEFSMRNVCHLVHKIHFIFEYLHLNPGCIFQSTELFRIYISLLIMYSSYMVIVLDP